MGAVRLVLADVDGTLVTSDKTLTPRAVEAVRRLGEAGIAFAVTSGRPPRGMGMLVDPLALATPIAGFNGGAIVSPDLAVVEERSLPAELVGPVGSELDRFGLEVWCYDSTDWYVPDPEGPHVAREAWTVQFEPKPLGQLEDHATSATKLVGVSDDHEAVAAATRAVHDRFGDHLTAAASQPYYLDVTHPEANKAHVATWLAGRLGLGAHEIATIGDMPNDILMFAHSGLSIAMGNADPQVKRAARRVTDANDDDGFAKAIERFVLGA